MFFAGLTAVVAKAGLKNVSADSGLAVRTCFVFVFVWMNLFVFGQERDFSRLSSKDVMFLGVSALTTSISWIFYYKAIKLGNVSEVALIDKASILVTLVLSFLFLKEEITWRVLLGATLMVAGLLIIATK